MDEQIKHRDGRLRSARPRRMAAVIAALAVTGLLAAACGGSNPAATSASSPKPLAEALDAFVQCMHQHGEQGLYLTQAPNSPNPGTDLLVIRGMTIAGADVGSSQFQSGLKACQHVLPFKISPPDETHQEFLDALKAADCMHTHGYPNWPDPRSDAAGTDYPAGLDSNSTQFQAAAKTCGVAAPPGG